MHRGRGRGRGGYGHRGGMPSDAPAFKTTRGDSPDQQKGTQAAAMMERSQELHAFFQRANGGPYPMLKDLRSRSFWLDNGNCRVKIHINTVQADPYAPPSQVRIQVPNTYRDVLADVSTVGIIAAEDFLLRSLHQKLSNSQGIEMLPPSQHVIQRSALVIAADHLELRIKVQMPGQGRRIDGHQCVDIFFHRVLKMVEQALFADTTDIAGLRRHIASIEDQEWLRSQLADLNLVAFVPDGAILPRRGGNSDLPMEVSKAVPFEAPSSFEQQFVLPKSQQRIRGLGIPKGITLIAGGGFHGKSTLLRALEVGVYNHVPGDGREFIVCEPSAVKIRAEDRRSVQGVDISMFINNIPRGASTTCFETSDASGSTSQAANIMEALELGSQLFLIDEDTSATNFMIRDPAMKELITSDKEPITPLVEKVGALHAQHGVSTVVVVGGSGQFLHVAHHVLAMDSYRVVDLTTRAKSIADAHPAGLDARALAQTAVVLPGPRFLDARQTFAPFRTERVKVDAVSTGILRINDEKIVVEDIEQLVEKGQTACIGLMLSYLFDHLAVDASEFASRLGSYNAEQSVQGAVGLQSIRWMVEATNASLCQRSFDHLWEKSSTYYGPPGFFARPRPFEFAAALNRLRTLAVRRR